MLSMCPCGAMRDTDARQYSTKYCLATALTPRCSKVNTRWEHEMILERSLERHFGIAVRAVSKGDGCDDRVIVSTPFASISSAPLARPSLRPHTTSRVQRVGDGRRCIRRRRRCGLVCSACVPMQRCSKRRATLGNVKPVPDECKMVTNERCPVFHQQRAAGRRRK